MEKKELIELEKLMPDLEINISTLENQMNECTDYSKLKKISDELEMNRQSLEMMTLRWLELSEKAEG